MDQRPEGTFAGGENPNYGKFGPDHPGSDTPCLKRREQPYRMPGKARATQTSGSRLVPKPVQKCQQPESRSMLTMQRNAHTRDHTNKGIEKADCRFCVEDSAGKSSESESES